MRVLKSGKYENLFQMADVRFTPEELQNMRNEGIHVVSDPEIAETDVMQSVPGRKTDIRGIVDRIALPRIMFPSANDIVEINGRQYYVIFVAEPKPKKNPEGTVYLMDITTGESVNMPFMQVADKLKAVRKENIKSSIGQINALITKWNGMISKIDKVANPSTWPLQLKWVTGVVDERIAELEGQEQAFMQKLDSATNFSPSYSSALARVKADLIAGSIPPADIYDTIMFVQHNDPDAIEEILDAPATPPEVKEKIRLLISIREQEIEKARNKVEVDSRERRERIESEPDTDGMLSPGTQPLISIEDKDVEEYAGKKTKTPDRYFTPQGRVGQIRAQLISIRQNKSELNEVKGGLEGLREFIGHLEKGERAKDILSGTERGTQIKQQIAEFVHKAKGFIRRYKVPVFVKNPESESYDVNPRLMGTLGGAGNSKVAVVINHMLSVIMNGLKTYAGQPEVVNAPVEQAVPENIESLTLLPQDTP